MLSTWVCGCEIQVGYSAAFQSWSARIRGEISLDLRWVVEMSNWMAVLRVSERTRMLDHSSGEIFSSSLVVVVVVGVDLEGRKPRPRKIRRHNLDGVKKRYEGMEGGLVKR